MGQISDSIFLACKPRAQRCDLWAWSQSGCLSRPPTLT